MLSFLSVEEGKLFIKKTSFKEFNLVFFRAEHMVWFEMQPRQRSFCWIFMYILHSMAKKITFLKGNLCIHKRFIVVLYIFFLRREKKITKCTPIWDDFVLNFAMCSADFTLVNGSTIQIVPLANYLKGWTFWFWLLIFKKRLLCLLFWVSSFIKLVHPSWNGSHLTCITFAKMSANFIQFLLSGSGLDTFRYTANEFYCLF